MSKSNRVSKSKTLPFALLAVSVLATSQLTACQSEVKDDVVENEVATSDAVESETVESETSDIEALVGTYASEGYDKKEEGYDWVAVKVTAGSEENTLAIDISARDDIKKPTCELTTTANAIADGQYLATDDGTAILFAFNNDALSVSAGEGSEAHDLMYYCSGGGSIAGDYQKLQK